VPHQWQLIIGTGLLGGYTTFSTASFETVRLIEDRRYVAAAFNGVSKLLICTAAAALGFAAAVALCAIGPWRAHCARAGGSRGVVPPC
jgi:protein CrcB